MSSTEDILQLLPNAILIVNSNGDITFSNSEVEKMFGYNNGELTNENVEILIPDRNRKEHVDTRSNYIKQISQRFMNRKVPLRGKKKDGTELGLEITLSPIQIKEGAGILAVIRDSSYKEYVRLLESKNKELEQFTYVASHDLQEPLRNINSFSELLVQEYGDKLGEDGKQFLQIISDGCNRMTSLIKNLLDYGRVGQQRVVGIVDCDSLLEDVLADLETVIREKKAKVEVDELPILAGSEIEVRMLFQNLIGNALKYCKSDIIPEIKISVDVGPDFWTFSVKDNGIGILPEHKDRIFKIFQRLHNKSEYEGTGIGLAQCEKIVDLMGGKIWVDSESNNGSTFNFTIRK